MSQTKVDAYKKEKRNRKKNVAREKRMKIIRPCIVILCLCLVAGTVFYIVKHPSTAAESTTQADKEALQEELLKQLTESGASVSTGDSEAADASTDSSADSSEATD